MALGYYTNFELSRKKLLQLIQPLFVVNEMKPIYYKLKTLLWSPAWFIYAQKREVDAF